MRSLFSMKEALKVGRGRDEKVASLISRSMGPTPGWENQKWCGLQLDDNWEIIPICARGNQSPILAAVLNGLIWWTFFPEIWKQLGSWWREGMFVVLLSHSWRSLPSSTASPTCFCPFNDSTLFSHSISIFSSLIGLKRWAFSDPIKSNYDINMTCNQWRAQNLLLKGWYVKKST